MRIVLLLLFTLAVVTANAQPTNTTPALEPQLTAANTEPTNTTPALESQLTRHFSSGTSLLSYEMKPNEIVKGHVTYSGLVVEIVKLGNPLQLLNPAAPSKYGSAEDNVMRDPMSGSVSGWKIFSIKF